MSMSSQTVFTPSVRHTRWVPKLWSETIATHRNAVRDATLDTTAALVTEHGLASVTMSQIAEQTGIGRATLYKYFPDIESILAAWHERQIANHLQQLEQIRDRATSPVEQLEAVLHGFAQMSHGDHDLDMSALLHRGDHVIRAHQQLHDFITDLIAAGATAGDLRADVPPRELATYCLHALTSASSLQSKAAIHRLVAVTLAGMSPPS
jgi:AcrR family transcriptional regulator